MPTSKNRPKHKHHHYHPKAQTKTSHAATARTPARRSAVTMMVILLAIFGAGIAFLSGGTNAAWLAGGALLGAITGYFIGQGIDKMAAKNK